VGWRCEGWKCEGWQCGSWRREGERCEDWRREGWRCDGWRCEDWLRAGTPPSEQSPRALHPSWLRAEATCGSYTPAGYALRLPAEATPQLATR
jgi:hypothetical protein